MKNCWILSLVLVLGCTAMQQNPPAAAPAATSEFKNLQVLPRDIQRDELIATMRGFTRGLGVKCNHCHVVAATEPKEQLDFPADDKEAKRIARVMLRMVGDINGNWMQRVEAAEGHPPAAPGTVAEMKVTCWTCHRGHEEPEAPPPAE